MNSKNCLRALACAGAVLGGFSASADIPASAYVQDGLVAQWDGIDNAGTGTHDATATTWVDRVGNRSTTKVNTKGSGGTWSENCFVEGSSVSSCFWCEGDDLKSLIQSGELSVEIFCSHTSTISSSKYEDWLGFGKDGSSRWLKLDIRSGDSSAPVFQGLQYRTTSWNNAAKIPVNTICAWGDTPQYGAVVCERVNDKQTATLYGNGANKIHSTNYGTVAPTDGVFTFGGFGKGGSALYNAKIYSVRLYNRALTPEEVALNAAIDRLRFGGQDDRYRWNDTTGKLEILVTAECRGVAGSTVALNGGASAKSASCWAEYGSTLSIALTPAAGTSLNRWEGGTPTAGGTAGTYSIAVTEPLSLVAVCGNETKTWAGASGARWDDESSWDPEGVPAEGDVVFVPAGSSVLLDGLTAHLGFADIAGTVTCTNWTTCIEADTVIVRKDGKVTCAGPVTDEAEMCRAYLKGVDVIVEAGGSVDATGKGWAGGKARSSGIGYGPGAAQRKASMFGGAHGGLGSGKPSVDDVACLATNIYGNAAAPETAGSGGTGANGTAGGGVVRIEATGRVTVNGSILANGMDSGNSSGGGAGGSIYITCTTFAGTHGLVRARGGNSSTAYGGASHSAGGGRVAILFDTEAQQALGAPTDCEFSADCGPFIGPGESSFSQAYPGSVYFSSDALLNRAGATLFGQLDFANVTTKWTVDSVRLTNGWAMLARDDVEMEVLGDFEVTGKALVDRRWVDNRKPSDAANGTRWDLGSATVYFATNLYCLYRHASAVPKLTVGGDLKIGDSGILDIIAARDPVDPAATGAFAANVGALVSVSGAVTLTKGKIYCRCHPYSGASPVISAGSVSVDASSFVDSQDEGFFGSKGAMAAKNTWSCSPTWPLAKCGGGHGGSGGWCSENKTNLGQPYDDLVWPTMPGSGANSNYSVYTGPRGGGVIRLSVAKDVVVDGALRASATSIASFSGSGAGGTVLVVCDRLVGSGDVQAKGCNAYQHTLGSSGLNGGAGGGGRIAIHYNPSAQANATCAVTFSAAGGVGVGDGVYTGNGEAGTVWMTDDKLLAGGTTFAHKGQIYNPNALDHLRMASLVLDGGLLEFPAGGYVDIDGDVTITGASAGSAGLSIPEGYFRCGGKLTMNGGHIDVTGGATPKSDRFVVGGDMSLDNAQVTLTCAETDAGARFDVGGELFMTNSSLLTLQSPCNPAEGEPGLVFSARALKLFENCWIYPYSHSTNGASVLFKFAGNATCAPGGGFDASGKGYATTQSGGKMYHWGPTVSEEGPIRTDGRALTGSDGSNCSGGGYGGNGGGEIKEVGTKNYPFGRGLAWGNRRKPVYPGVGGGCYYNVKATPRGGGLVRIETGLVFDLNGGSLLAEGGAPCVHRSGASGGAVYLRAWKFFGGGGLVSVKGGQGNFHANDGGFPWAMPSGGGGRVAIWCANVDEAKSDVTVNIEAGETDPNYKDTYDEEVRAYRTGQPGTRHWGEIGGLKVLVR